MLIPNLHTVLRIESKKKDNEKDSFFFHIYKRSNARKLQTCLPPDLQSSGSSWWGGEVRRILPGKCCEQAGEKAGRRCLWQCTQQGGLEQATSQQSWGSCTAPFQHLGTVMIFHQRTRSHVVASSLSSSCLTCWLEFPGGCPSPHPNSAMLSTPFPEAPYPSRPPQLHSSMHPEGELSLYWKTP